MTKTFAVNSRNDLYLDVDGNIAIVSDLQAVLQACEHAAKAQLGEMVLAVDQGIPYFQTVWSGVLQIPQFEAALRKAFLAVTGVVEVVSLTVIQEDDVLNYTAVIRTIYGEGGISG